MQHLEPNALAYDSLTLVTAVESFTVVWYRPPILTAKSLTVNQIFTVVKPEFDFISSRLVGGKYY
jgi:hypothetical protein